MLALRVLLRLLVRAQPWQLLRFLIQPPQRLRLLPWSIKTPLLIRLMVVLLLLLHLLCNMRSTVVLIYRMQWHFALSPNHATLLMIVQVLRVVFPFQLLVALAVQVQS